MNQPSKKRACFDCKKKIGLMGFECNYCHNNYCSSHRLPEDHKCTCISEVNNKYKEMAKEKLLSEATKSNKVTSF